MWYNRARTPRPMLWPRKKRKKVEKNLKKGVDKAWMSWYINKAVSERHRNESFEELERDRVYLEN